MPEEGDLEITWDDVQMEWKDIFLREGPADLQSDVGFFLGRLDCLINSDFAAWATMDEVVDFVMEWRFDWPRQNDPAFGPLDSVLQSYSPNYHPR